MAKQLATKWRHSSSLIILAKDKLQAASSRFDYKALLFSRADAASFMPGVCVFPGGVYEQEDESLQWLQHFNKFGIDNSKLAQLTNVQGTRPDIFNQSSKDALAREIALRITAIRETFEEVGIVFARKPEHLADNNGYGHFIADFDHKHWQRLVHKDPSKFLTLCQELQVVPDLWSLYEWSVWLTPADFKKRFETVFYVIALQKMPELFLEKKEAKSFAWRTPLDYLQAYRNCESFLPPPQFYELSRFLNFHELQQLKNFAQERNNKGSILVLPIQYDCADGIVCIYPGDEMYPSNAIAVEGMIKTKHLNMQQLRENIKTLHRAEFERSYFSGKSKIFLNFQLDQGHINPVDVHAN